MQVIYLLVDFDGYTLAVCSSKEELATLATLQIQKSPEVLLSMEEWALDKLEAIRTWDWVYIPEKGYSVTRLSAGGGEVPQKKYWGHNLLTLPEVSDPEYPGQKWKSMWVNK